MCTSMISLSKVAHQIWNDHPFSKTNKTTEWPVRVWIKATGMQWGWKKLEKGKGVGNIGGSSKNRGVKNPLPNMGQTHEVGSDFFFS